MIMIEAFGCSRVEGNLLEGRGKRKEEKKRLKKVVLSKFVLKEFIEVYI